MLQHNSIRMAATPPHRADFLVRNQLPRRRRRSPPTLRTESPGSARATHAAPQTHDAAPTRRPSCSSSTAAQTPTAPRRLPSSDGIESAGS